jgi:hypothetical protein
MQNIWNHDLNLLYYVNYQFPIASEGYGSTADQILLWEGDVVSMSLYTDWSFYSDEAAGFHHLGTPTNMVQGPIEAKSDETLDLTLYRSSAAMGDKEHQTACGNLDVYYTRADSVPVITAAIDALSSSLTEEALSPVALASIPNLEQLVTMLCRYAQMKGCDVSDLASLSCYTDASGVSDWALQSMQWAVSAGLIAGRSATTLAPGALPPARRQPPFSCVLRRTSPNKHPFSKKHTPSGIAGGGVFLLSAATECCLPLADFSGSIFRRKRTIWIQKMSSTTCERSRDCPRISWPKRFLSPGRQCPAGKPAKPRRIPKL